MKTEKYPAKPRVSRRWWLAISVAFLAVFFYVNMFVISDSSPFQSDGSVAADTTIAAPEEEDSNYVFLPPAEVFKTFFESWKESLHVL